MIPEFARNPNPVGVPLPGISKIHSLQLRGDEVVARKYPCFECRLGQLCIECQQAKGVRRRPDVRAPPRRREAPDEVENGGEEEEDEEEETDASEILNREEGDNSDVGHLSEDDDGGVAVVEEQDEEEDEEEGSVVWACFR